MDDVQPFALGRGEAQAPVMLSGLNRLGERLGRRVREIVEPFVGVKPVITARPVELIDYGAWAVQVQPLAAIGLYRLMPLKGQVMLHLSAAMISTFVERFYGGAGGRPSPARSEFTPTEERLIARISDAVMAALAVSWSDMLAVEPVLASREAGLGFASGLQASDQMALQRFTVAISASEQWPVDILLPVSALRSIEPLMDTSVKEEKAEPDQIGRAHV
jgi:flagellar motor switch protein FliM